MKIVFMGTARFALPSLEALLASGNEVVAVVTQPDRPRGRGLRLVFSPVKEFALSRNLPVLQPETLRDEKAKEEILPLKPDLVAVAAYGKILPKWLFDEVKYGSINVHASSLPRYRGAAPIQRAIMNGETETGVTIIQMDEGLDTGDILARESVSVGPEETAGELEDKLARLGAELLLGTIEGIQKGAIKPEKQVGEATYAEKVTKEEAEINWEKPAEKIKDLIRALNPQPGAFTFYNGMRVKVWRVRIVEAAPTGTVTAATVVAVGKDGFTVACEKDSLLVTEVQPENRKRMSGAEFCRGFHLQVGDKLAVRT
ncbi:MAG: methionyl-tRNA formyltransferase [Actinomycetota bacterium]